MNKKTKEHYAQLRAHSQFIKTVAVTPEVYQWILESRGKKSRAQFLDDELKDHRRPNLFKQKKHK